MNFKLLLFWISVACWLTAVVIVTASFAGFDWFELLAFPLAIGLLPLIVGIFYAKRQVELKSFGELQKPGPFANIMGLFKGSPRWLGVLTVVCVLYGVVVALLFAAGNNSEVAVNAGGKFELHGADGHFIAELTRDGYEHYKAVDARLFSGVFLFVYSIGMTAFYPWKKKGN